TCDQETSVDNVDRTDLQERRTREARLRPEFAHLYPPLEPGRWEPAALLADRVVAWMLRQPDRGYMAPERVLRSDHFEFRGGVSTPESHSESHRRNSPT
ncbi:MAG: hypothetical protein ACJ8AV_14720, partial [Gemmatimonadales bacterium]